MYAPSALIENALPGVQPPISLPSRLAICLRTANPPVTFIVLARKNAGDGIVFQYDLCRSRGRETGAQLNDTAGIFLSGSRILVNIPKLVFGDSNRSPGNGSFKIYGPAAIFKVIVFDYRICGIDILERIGIINI